MAEAAVQILNQPYACVEAFRIAAVRERARSTSSFPPKEILVLGSILIVLQVIDGLLTAYGVKSLGIYAEGNPFIRSLMEQIGHVPALVIVKATAAFIIAHLCTLSHTVSWISGALKGMIGVYLFAAILPWTAILYSHII